MTEIPAWHIAGDWFDNCSCAVACPCPFAQAPDNGYCESVLFWHIQRGHYGDVGLDDLSLVRAGRWEGDLWAGKVWGTAGLFIDERPDERQAEALPLIFGGRAGGFPAQVAALFTEGRQVRGVERARITFEIAPDRSHWGAEIAGKVRARAKALRDVRATYGGPSADLTITRRGDLPADRAGRAKCPERIARSGGKRPPSTWLFR